MRKCFLGKHVSLYDKKRLAWDLFFVLANEVIHHLNDLP
jgi:hypothetical protein